METALVRRRKSRIRFGEHAQLRVPRFFAVPALADMSARRTLNRSLGAGRRPFLLNEIPIGGPPGEQPSGIGNGIMKTPPQAEATEDGGRRHYRGCRRLTPR